MIPVRFERHQFFSGNGIAVAAMCAALHKHRPVAANEGGLTGKVDISLEMAPVAHLWLTHGQPESIDKAPQPHK